MYIKYRRLCKKCNQLKECTYTGVTLYNKIIEVDESGRKWVGNVCGICTIPLKKVKEVPQIGIINYIKCSCCKVVKEHILVNIYKSGQKAYQDESKIGKWAGTICNNCININRKLENRLKKGIEIQLNCMYCNNKLEGICTKRYCSKKCYHWYQSSLKPVDYSIRAHCPWSPPEVDYTIKAHCKWLPPRRCNHCNKNFNPKSDRSLYCKRSHTPGAIRSRRRWKKLRGNGRIPIQPISLYYALDILEFYNNRPEGMEVDHIVPLNGENVSGLHVPWNFQYLTPEENRNKSNKLLY